jgi:hypothetical protein
MFVVVFCFISMNTPNAVIRSCFDTLLAATAADDLEQFVSVGNYTFRNVARSRPEAFHRVSRNLAPRMQKGFTAIFLGELCQKHYTAYLWRLRFDDGGEDLLFRMGMACGQVSGALVGKSLS